MQERGHTAMAEFNQGAAESPPMDDDSRAEAAEGHRLRRIALIVAVVVAVVVSGVGLGLWLKRDGDALPRLGPELTYTLESVTPAKDKFTLGLDIFAAGKTLEIVSVTPLTSPNVEYLGAFAAWPRDHRGTVYAGGPGYPSEDQPNRHPLHEVVPVAETSLVPKGFDGTQPVTVNAGFRLLSGVGAVNGVTVVYKLDGDTERKHYRYALIACMKTEKCNRDLEDDDFTSDVLRRYGLVED